jgi:hypothetical protein
MNEYCENAEVVQQHIIDAFRDCRQYIEHQDLVKNVLEKIREKWEKTSGSNSFFSDEAIYNDILRNIFRLIDKNKIERGGELEGEKGNECKYGKSYYTLSLKFQNESRAREINEGAKY